MLCNVHETGIGIYAGRLAVRVGKDLYRIGPVQTDTKEKKQSEEAKRERGEGEGGRRVAGQDTDGGHRWAVGELGGLPRLLLPLLNLDREREEGRKRKGGRKSQ